MYVMTVLAIVLIAVVVDVVAHAAATACLLATVYDCCARNIVFSLR